MNNFELSTLMIIIGGISFLFTQVIQLPETLFLSLLIFSLILNARGLVGLFLHYKNRNKDD